MSIIDNNISSVFNIQTANHFLVTDDGKIVVFFIGRTPGAVYYRVSEDGGATWGGRQTVRLGAPANDLSVAGVQVGDTYYGVAEDYDGGIAPTILPFKLVYDPAAGLFTLSTGIALAKTGPPRPQVVWDSDNDYLHVIDEVGGPILALYAFDTDLNFRYTWNHPEIASGTGLLLANGSRLYVLIHKTNGDPFDFRVAIAGAASYTVGDPETGLPASPMADSAYELLWGKDGKVEVVYNKEGIDRVQYVRRLSVSNWTSPADVDLGDVRPDVGSYLDRTGSPLRTIVYADTNQFRRTATGWVTDAVALPILSTLESIAVPVDSHTVRALYYDVSGFPIFQLGYVEYKPWGDIPEPVPFAFQASQALWEIIHPESWESAAAPSGYISQHG